MSTEFGCEEEMDRCLSSCLTLDMMLFFAFVVLTEFLFKFLVGSRADVWSGCSF